MDTTSTVPDEEAGERAIEAEVDRIERVVADWENLSSLSIGDQRAPEYTIDERNETGVVVTVLVGHSMSFECGFHVDGAATEVRYFVSETSVRVLTVIQDVYGRTNRPCR